MQKKKIVIHFSIILIVLLLVNPSTAQSNHDKNQKLSSFFLEKEYNDIRNSKLQIEEKLVKAIIYLKDGYKVSDIEEYAIVDVVSGNFLQVRTTQNKLREISELPYVYYIRKPKTPRISVVNEGYNTMEVSKLHSLNYSGNSVKIAVLDSGFSGYQSLVGTELPENVTVRSFRTEGNINTGGVHGTAVAEIVHDIVPDSELFFINFETELEFNEAVNWLISKDVDIITQSLGWTSGPFDGTGFIASIVNNAIDNGIIWVNSAGNYAKKHWEGSFKDEDNNGWHEFWDGDEYQDINVYAGNLIEVTLSWDDWSYVNQDYELFLVDKYGNIVDSSEDPQYGRYGHEPVESIEYIATYSGIYKIGIKKYSATRNVNFELYSSTHDLEYQEASSSLAVPSDVPRVVTVGATFWSNDVLESFSSQGPTNDGRIKPDLTAPDGVTTETYGYHSFFGTSASTPNVAASIALLMSASNLSQNEVKEAIENNALDLGEVGKDNLYGAGRVDVYNTYKQAVLPRLDILYPGSQKFNINDTIRIGGSSNRALERVNLTIKDTNITLEMNAITGEDGGWEISWNATDIFPGNYSINANLSSANANTSLILVNRALLLSTTPTVIFLGIPMSVQINARDLTRTPVYGVEVTLKGDNFTLTNTTNIDGDTLFFVNASGELRATANKTGYPETALNLTVKQLAGIAISVPYTLMKLHEVQNFTANAMDVDGFIYPIRVSWESSNILVGSIDSNGTFVAISAGTSNLTAIFQNYSVSANVIVGNASNGTLSRILPGSVGPNENFTVTLIPSDSGLFSDYKAVEMIPFSPPDRSTLVIGQGNGSNVTYSLTSPAVNGTYIFNGRFEDKFHNVGDISGEIALIVGNIISGYDRNGNGKIDKDEAIQAVIDYFNRIITRQQAMDVVMAYFT